MTPLEPLNYVLLSVGAFIALFGLRTHRLWQLLSAYSIVTLAAYIWLMWVGASGSPGSVPYFAMVCGSFGLIAVRYRHVGLFSVGFLGTTSAVTLFTTGGMLLPAAGWGETLSGWVRFYWPMAKLPHLEMAPLPPYALPPETVAIVAVSAGVLGGAVCLLLDFYGEALFLSVLAAVLVGLGLERAVVAMGVLPVALFLQLLTNKPKKPKAAGDGDSVKKDFGDTGKHGGDSDSRESNDE